MSEAKTQECESLRARTHEQCTFRSGAGLDLRLERLLDLERRSLLAEQARQLAHALRSPLSVIDFVSETLRLDEADDRVRLERLERIQGAVSGLARGLSETVDATRFGDGPRRPLNVLQLASEVIGAFGGEVGEPGETCEQGTELVEVEPASFEVALVHALRLIGVGTEPTPSADRRLVLTSQRNDGVLHLSIEVISPDPREFPSERADLRLMALSARRAAEELGGRLTLESNRAVFELPVAGN